MAFKSQRRIEKKILHHFGLWLVSPQAPRLTARATTVPKKQTTRKLQLIFHLSRHIEADSGFAHSWIPITRSGRSQHSVMVWLKIFSQVQTLEVEAEGLYSKNLSQQQEKRMVLNYGYREMTQ